MIIKQIHFLCSHYEKFQKIQNSEALRVLQPKGITLLLASSIQWHTHEGLVFLISPNWPVQWHFDNQCSIMAEMFFKMPSFEMVVSAF